MALSMHTNYASLVTQNNITKTNDLLNTSMERLSTGLRINSAADDAAGLQIANRLEAQTRGMSVAMRNAQDGISMMQTAEGAMDEMTNIAYRMNDLATQAANGTNSDAALASLSSEFQALGEELENIITNTSFGGNNLLDATGAISSGVTFQIGSSQAETMPIGGAPGGTASASKTGLAALKAFAADAKTADFTAAGAGHSPLDMMDALSVNSDSGTGGAGSAADGGVIGQLGAVRSDLGASINRLEHTMTNLGNMVENTSAAKGRIMDADFAGESSNMTKNQMLMQAGTTVLSQTNQLPGMAMSLLR